MAKIIRRKFYRVEVTIHDPSHCGANWALYADRYPTKAEAKAAVKRAITGSLAGYQGARIIEEYRLG